MKNLSRVFFRQTWRDLKRLSFYNHLPAVEKCLDKSLIYIYIYIYLYLYIRTGDSSRPCCRPRQILNSSSRINFHWFNIINLHWFFLAEIFSLIVKTNLNCSYVLLLDITLNDIQSWMSFNGFLCCIKKDKTDIFNEFASSNLKLIFIFSRKFIYPWL